MKALITLYHGLCPKAIRLVLLIKRKWILRIYQVYLIGGAVIWIERLFYLRKMRIEEGSQWIRLALILGAVALVALLSVFMLENKKVQKAYPSRR